jgi:hypothetical protein
MVERIGWEGETTMRGLAVFVVVLSVCLAFSLLLSGYLYYELNKSTEHHSTFFSFVFSPKMQNLTSGNLYLNLTFDIVKGNLTVKAEVNADSYNEDAFLALQFDSDNNGTIDIRQWKVTLGNETFDIYQYDFSRDDSQFLLGVNNKTRPSDFMFWGWFSNGTIYFSRCLPSSYPWTPESPFHSCTYNNSVYTFYFSFPIEPTPLSSGNCPWLSGEHGIQGKLVRALYGIEPPSDSEHPEEGMTVYIPPFKFME